MSDLSPAEREIKNLLVNQLREWRIAEPNKSFCIHNNRVIQLSNSTGSNNCSLITLNNDKVTVACAETTPVSDPNPGILGRNDRHPRNTYIAIILDRGVIKHQTSVNSPVSFPTSSTMVTYNSRSLTAFTPFMAFNPNIYSEGRVELPTRK
ncbi:hypothetical protein GJ496_006905 [Pomphorhynchus laevis]|nr:hypothetical protein GJ496_006905 [Pomphorhynchus laevis]